MKNTTVRAFSISSDAEKIIDSYASKRGFKSKSKAVDTLLKEYNVMERKYKKLLMKYRKEVKEIIENDIN